MSDTPCQSRDTVSAVHRAIAAVWRMESPRILGALMRLVGDLGRAEDVLQETLTVALERWPAEGMPAKPGAWLTAVARRRALDGLRHQQMQARKHTALAAEISVAEATTGDSAAEALEAALDDTVGDDLLRLILIACSPVLSVEAQVALTLRLVVGLSTADIARAFLQAEPSIAQRIVRAKRTLAEARVPFDVPTGAELAARVPAVLAVVYLIFNEGYSAPPGAGRVRRNLCEEALRLGRIWVGMVPEVSEAHGLLALMELHASRSAARFARDGTPILLLEQRQGRWDQLLIRRGLAGLERAAARAAQDRKSLGVYALQAAISACHARAGRPEDTDWPRIVALYDGLEALTGSPVVALNRAMAISMAWGPAEALPLVAELAEDPALRRYHLLPSVEGDLLLRLGRFSEAKMAFERAAELAPDATDRAALRAQAARCVEASALS